MNSSTFGGKQAHDIRAPPRRRAKKDEQEDQPIFLRKAYAMVSSCPYEIGKRFFFKFNFLHLILHFLI
jgi:hypothetical protein